MSDPFLIGPQPLSGKALKKAQQKEAKQQSKAPKQANAAAKKQAKATTKAAKQAAADVGKGADVLSAYAPLSPKDGLGEAEGFAPAGAFPWKMLLAVAVLAGAGWWLYNRKRR